MARKHGQQDEAEINLTPMLDVTFIMLIFFIVTTSFVKEAGIEVKRPTAATTLEQKKANIMIAVSPNGEIYMQKKSIDLASVRGYVEAMKAENPEGSVVIIADEKSDSGVVVDVMDQVKLAGVDKMAIAAQLPEGG